MHLVEDVETAILEQLSNPLAFETLHSAKKRERLYYRIYIRNYVVIDDVMEVRRLIYGERDIDRHL